MVALLLKSARNAKKVTLSTALTPFLAGKFQSLSGGRGNLGLQVNPRSASAQKDNGQEADNKRMGKALFDHGWLSVLRVVMLELKSNKV